jgi:hypothetical protein
MRAPNTVKRVPISGEHGKALYELVCFSGNDAAEAALGDFIYSAGLQCGLGVAGDSAEMILGHATLLDEETTAMHSRGTFHPPDMVGNCARYPDYGTTREFLLRGFRLILRLSAIEVAPDYKGGYAYVAALNESRESYPVGRLKLTVVVAPEPTALGAKALPSRFVNPKGDPRACAKVEVASTAQ